MGEVTPIVNPVFAEEPAAGALAVALHTVTLVPNNVALPQASVLRHFLDKGLSVYDRQALIELIQRQALQFGQFTLASGKTASYYLDCRKVTLDATGARLIAEGIFELLEPNWPDAVGGMAVGADPITGAVITLAGMRGKQLKGFIVRKEPKTHGTRNVVEGPVSPADRCVVLEDVVTTGSSSLEAIARLEAQQMRVVGIIAVVDRLEGAAQTFHERGYPFQSLLTVRDLGIQP
ncbi:MAG: orotate phosphoribosyltransferase [Pirellulaceae bacterium]|nr:MAG: orotate phosphoribosyltransferase [Pirellulaceae bacterium]